MNGINGLFDFIKNCPSPYHTVKEAAGRLASAGYKRLFEGDRWELSEGGKYFTVRNGTSLIAFRYKKGATGFNIIASHSDSPSFKVKESAEQKGAYTRLEVEKYGGMIYYSWLDRPLSVAGRALVNTDEGIEARLVNIDRDLVSIPSLAIHFNRGVNDGAKLNPATDMLPLYSLSKDKSLRSLVAEAAEVKEEDISSFDLYLYNRDEGRVFGAEDEFILCPRLDDLQCVYSSLIAFIESEDSEALPVLAIFDNEEVGSDTKQGAASTFLPLTLERIGGENYIPMLSGSFIVSADNAHAKHPAHPEMSDPDNAPMPNGGVVIKYNASQRYATDGLSKAVFEKICERAGVKTQLYYNRADLPGGSTLGSIADTRVSVPTVDIGFAQLAMHSANETAGARDLAPMIKAMATFFATPLSYEGEKIKF